MRQEPAEKRQGAPVNSRRPLLFLTARQRPEAEFSCELNKPQSKPLIVLYRYPIGTLTGNINQPQRTYSVFNKCSAEMAPNNNP